MNDLPRLSASKIATYLDCPVRYKYRYLEGTKDQPNIYAWFGTAMHKAIQLYYEEGINPNVTLQDRMSRVTGDVLYLDKAMLLTHNGHEMLDSMDFSLYAPIELEKYFRLPYPNEEDAICTIEGYIDLVAENYIVDFKTGKEKPTKIDDNIQFIIYYWAFNKLYGRNPDYVIYHRLRDHKQYKLTAPNFTLLEEIIQTILIDPMNYELKPCDNCSWFCNVRNAVDVIH
jgi:CRISPR/Cas system-associated exonuclease Cas4 (RecB family)